LRLIDLEEIAKAKYIVIVTNNDTFCNASALYTYMLQLHKKVSLFSEFEIKKCYAFLPWFDKVRHNRPTGAEYSIDVQENSLVSFFHDNQIKINQKMAQSLYAGLLQKAEALQNRHLDGMFFAQMSELIDLGAQHEVCVSELFQQNSLALFRLKAKMFENMLLKDDATQSFFLYKEEYLQESGATMQDVYTVMQESLGIAHVKQAVLVDKNNKIIKTIEEK
jgi:phosphoesterase RecJ-like protein